MKKLKTPRSNIKVTKEKLYNEIGKQLKFKNPCRELS